MRSQLDLRYTSVGEMSEGTLVKSGKKEEPIEI